MCSGATVGSASTRLSPAQICERRMLRRRLAHAANTHGAEAAPTPSSEVKVNESSLPSCDGSTGPVSSTKNTCPESSTGSARAIGVGSNATLTRTTRISGSPASGLDHSDSSNNSKVVSDGIVGVGLGVGVGGVHAAKTVAAFSQRSHLKPCKTSQHGVLPSSPPTSSTELSARTPDNVQISASGKRML